MSNMIERSFNNLVTGKVFSDFNAIPNEGQKRVILKTALIALAAGILTGIIAGALPAIIIAGVVGLAAFSYSVTRYSPGDFIGDSIRGAVRRVTYQKDVIDELIDEAGKLVDHIKAKFDSSRREVSLDDRLHSIHRQSRAQARNLQARFAQRPSNQRAE